MENEKIERIKNPKLSAGRIPDLLKASIMESQKKLTLVQKKDGVATMLWALKYSGFSHLCTPKVSPKLAHSINERDFRPFYLPTLHI